MKKIIAIFLIMIILFALVSNVVFAKTGTINTTTVRMRREANTSSDILQLIGEESEVEILGEENGWYKVEYNGITGYVSSDYVDVEGEEPDETNPADVPEEPETPDEPAAPETPPTTSTPEEPTDNTLDNPTTNEEPNNNNVEEPSNNEPSANAESSIRLTKDAELRRVPSFASKKYNTISEGTTVTVIDNLNNWCKITDGTNSGWVIRQNVD